MKSKQFFFKQLTLNFILSCKESNVKILFSVDKDEGHHDEGTSNVTMIITVLTRNHVTAQNAEIECNEEGQNGLFEKSRIRV